MKQYLFFIDLPLLEKAFYFLAEETLMKKPLIAYEQIGEEDILEVRHNAQGEIEFKKSNKSSAQLILNEIRKYDIYPGYGGDEEKLFYHYHNLFEISIVLSGRGYYFAEGRCIKVQAGSIVAFNGLVPHAWIADKEDPPRLRTFKFYQNLFLENEIEEEQWKLINDYLSTFTVIDLHGKEAEKSFTILQLMYEEYINKNKGYRECIRNLLLVFLVYIMRQDINGQENTKKRGHHAEIENAVKYMKNNFHLNLALEDVAKVVYMHPNYFSAVFKKAYGISFIDYMNRLKVSMATELMESTQLPIPEIAMRCGFTSLSNFYRVFKSVQGISPAKYIKQLKF